MQRALVLTSACVFFINGFAVADGPALNGPDSSLRARSKPGSGNSSAVRPASRLTPAGRKKRSDGGHRQEIQRTARTSRPRDAAAESRKQKAAAGHRKDLRRSSVDDDARSSSPDNRRKRGSQKAEQKKAGRSRTADSAATGNRRQAPGQSGKRKPKPLTPAARTPKPATRGNRKAADADRKNTGATPVREAELPLIVPQAVRAPSYASVRSTIPFSRSEWAADPSYRHNGTMELILGQLRDLVVYQSPPGVQQGPGMPSASGITINNAGGYPGYYGFGGIPFGFNPGTNGAAQSRAIINSFQTHGFIGRGAPVLP